MAQRGLDLVDAKLYKLTVGANLGITLKGPDGQDFDLYVKKGSAPTTESYDAVGFSGSADEKVVIQSATPGDYFIIVRSYRGAGDFNLSVNFEN